MSIEVIRKANADDQPVLHRLWESVFDDPPDLVQAFYDRFPPEISGWVVCLGTKICSAAYLIPGNWFISPQEMFPAAYVYAVATDPSERKKGYAGKLMQAIASFARQRGILLYTRPAERSLFPWYEQKLGADNIGYFQERQFRLVSLHEPLPCRRLSAEEYGTARELQLAAIPHILLSENFLRLQETYSDGFYAVGDGCCCVVKENDTLQIPELLVPKEQREICVQSLLAQFDLKKADVRTVGIESNEPGIAYTGAARPTDTNWGFFLE